MAAVGSRAPHARDVSAPYGPRHPEVRPARSRARPALRVDARACLLEGPRVIDAALERGADAAQRSTSGHGAAPAFPDLVARVRRRRDPGAPPQGRRAREGRHDPDPPARAGRRVLGAPSPRRASPPRRSAGSWSSRSTSPIPGTSGRSCAAPRPPGRPGVVVAGAGVDVRSPKVVRASAGALFGVPVAEAPRRRRRGRRRSGRSASGAWVPSPRGGCRSGGEPTLGAACAIVVGNEAHGISPDLAGRTRRYGHHPHGRSRRVAQRRDGRDGAVLRGGAPALRVRRGGEPVNLDDALALLAAAPKPTPRARDRGRRRRRRRSTALEREWLGKRSPATAVNEAIKTFAADERPRAGQAVGAYRAAVGEVVAARRAELEAAAAARPRARPSTSRSAGTAAPAAICTSSPRSGASSRTSSWGSATGSPRVPRSRTTGTTSRRSTSRRRTRPARCRTPSTSTSGPTSR